MFQQLTLMMAVPPLLVYGSPGKLLLRAVPHRYGGRAVLRTALWGLRARWGRVALHPAFMVPLFLFSFYGVYFTGISDALLSTWAGHTGLELLFLASGIVFTVPLISRDPLPPPAVTFRPGHRPVLRNAAARLFRRLPDDGDHPPGGVLRPAAGGLGG